MTPDYSIIVPVYKVEPYLRQCVNSILAQTYGNFELFLVDDGSPDNCGAICDEYAAKDSRVTVLHQENKGVMAALIAGIQAATAPYVGFVDGDDWIDPSYYEDLMDALRQSGADAAVAEYIRYFPQEKLSFRRPAPVVYSAPEGGRAMLYAAFPVVEGAAPVSPDISWKPIKLYRRALLTDNLPYFTLGVYLGEDVLMNVAVLADCASVILLSGKACYHNLIRSGSASHPERQRHWPERLVQNEELFLQTMSRIIEDKGMDWQYFARYYGRSLYSAVVNASARTGVSFGAKRRYALGLLSIPAPGCLAAYAAYRKNPFVTLYCTLLRARLVTPCILISMVFDCLSGWGQPKGDAHDA